MVTKVRSLRYGVIGVGMMGCEHIRNLMAIADCEVVAYADPFEASRSNAKALVAGATSYVDHRSMLAEEKLDVVIISTPNHTHRAVLEDVLKARVHVLVEKPMCISAQECREVIALAQQTTTVGRVITVGLEYRFMAPTQRLLHEVESGTCGTPKMITIREHRFPFLQKVGNWNRFSKNTGGTLVEKCCHFFDLMNLVAKSTPVSIFASGAQDVNHLTEIYDGMNSDILDNAYVIVEYSNGVRGMLELSMFAEGTRNEQEITVVGSEAKIEALITESLIRIGKRALGQSGVVEYPLKQPDGVVQGLHHGASYLEHLAMQSAIRQGRQSAVTLQDGLLSTAIGQAAHLSIAEKRVVQLSEILN